MSLFSKWVLSVRDRQGVEVMAPLTWNFRVAAMYLQAVNSPNPNAEERAYLHALVVQVWHIMTHTPVSRAYMPKDAFVR